MAKFIKGDLINSLAGGGTCAECTGMGTLIIGLRRKCCGGWVRGIGLNFGRIKG